MEMLAEQWAPIVGYEGRYEVSDRGRVKSLQRYRKGKAGSAVPMPEKIMRLQQKKRSPNNRTLPYIEVRLRDGSSRDIPCKTYLVHRLVAQAFIGELFEGSQVDHIDGVHGNNCKENLRILSTGVHSRLHPCIANAERNARMQEAAQVELRKLRESGCFVGRRRVPGPMKDEKDKPTRKALALRKWDC